MRAFYAYPSKPTSTVDAIISAVDEINGAGEVKVKPWSEMTIGGKPIITEILSEIDLADLLLADLTNLNPNVLFEVGYAIGRNKRLWLTIDRTLKTSNDKFDEFKILSTIGYTSYTSSIDIVKGFYKDHPHLDLGSTIFSKVIEPSLDLLSVSQPSILYLKPRFETQAGLALTKRISESPFQQIIDDPRESPLQTLNWYGTNCFNCSAIICHLTGPDRIGNAAYNARSALVAGMAHAMQRPVLMLTDEDYLTPIDYQHLSSSYTSAKNATSVLDQWLSPFERDIEATAARRKAIQKTAILVNQLKAIDVGEPIAENEKSEKISEYFIETAAYKAALRGATSMFVGQKGVGKSATFIKLRTDLEADPNVLVVAIKPPDYDIQAVSRYLSQLREKDERSFTLDALWKYLLYSEISRVLLPAIKSRVQNLLSVEELGALHEIEGSGFDLRESFSDRLISKLEQYSLANDIKATVSEDLHKGPLKNMKRVVAIASKPFRKIAIIIDNLDLAWDRSTNLQALPPIFLSLLDASRAISRDLQHETRRNDLTVSTAVFLRSDIFEHVSRASAEPDKLPITRMQWNDLELLGRLIDERLEASLNNKLPAEEIWSRYFAANVDGISTRSMLLHSVRPRPRDLIYAVRASITTAVNRGHSQVSANDVKSGIKEYSDFAFEVLKVESEIPSSQLDDLALTLISRPATATESDLASHFLKSNGLSEVDAKSVLELLVRHGMLGAETSGSIFEYPEDEASFRRIMARATAWQANTGATKRYRVHPAFWAFLSTTELDEVWRDWR